MMRVLLFIKAVLLFPYYFVVGIIMEIRYQLQKAQFERVVRAHEDIRQTKYPSAKMYDRAAREMQRWNRLSGIRPKRRSHSKNRGSN